MGSIWITHEEATVKAEWEGELSVPQFSDAVGKLTGAWVAVSGKHANRLPASALTYHTGEGE